MLCVLVVEPPKVAREFALKTKPVLLCNPFPIATAFEGCLKVPPRGTLATEDPCGTGECLKFSPGRDDGFCDHAWDGLLRLRRPMWLGSGAE
jgi:hypothetical protein